MYVVHVWRGNRFILYYAIKSCDSGHFFAVLRIRIRIHRIPIHRIHVFLGLLDPDPAPDPSITKQNNKKNLDFDCFVTSFWHFTFENEVKVPSKSNMQKIFFKICFLLASWRSMMKIEGSESASWSSGSISQRHGSADPDPDPHKNVMDPQQCF